MAPPTVHPRLCDLTPDGVASDVAVAIIEHVESLSNGEASRLRHSNVPAAFAAAALTMYAQSGDSTGINVLGSVEALVSKLIKTMHTSAAGARAVKPTCRTSWGLVAVAADARTMLEAGEYVTPMEISALASVSKRQVLHLIQRNEVAAHLDHGDYRIENSEARRWLGERGVPGFERPPSPAVV